MMNEGYSIFELFDFISKLVIFEEKKKDKERLI